MGTNAMSMIDSLDRTDDAVLYCDVDDDVLERAAGGHDIMANPTMPFAIICVPFVETDR